MSDFKMSSSRPYLMRALYEWLIDNQCTPHLLVDAKDPRVQVPREFVKDGQIVLNINPSAVGQFSWDNDWIEFSARFGGTPRRIVVPTWAVLALYARENGEGMAFGPAQPPMAEVPNDVSDKTATVARITSVASEKKKVRALTSVDTKSISEIDSIKPKKLKAAPESKSSSSNEPVKLSEDKPEQDPPKNSGGKSSAKKKPSLKVIK